MSARRDGTMCRPALALGFELLHNTRGWQICDESACTPLHPPRGLEHAQTPREPLVVQLCAAFYLPGVPELLVGAILTPDPGLEQCLVLQG